MTNLCKCSKCGVNLIQEELEIHQCLRQEDLSLKFSADTDDDYYEVFDGYRWIPIKLIDQPKGNREKTTDNETEPD